MAVQTLYMLHSSQRGTLTSCYEAVAALDSAGIGVACVLVKEGVALHQIESEPSKM